MPTICSRSTFLALFAISFVCISSQAQDLATVLKPKLIGQTVQLRTPCPDKKLSFDSKGEFKGQPVHGLRSIDTLLKIKKVKIQDSTLLLKGDRIGALWDPKQKKIVTSRTNSVVEISIDLPDGPKTTEDALLPLYFKVFNRPDESEKQWNRFTELANGHIEGHVTMPGAPKESQPDKSHGPVIGKVKGPKGIYTPDPPYSDAARAKHIQGTTVLRVAIGENGLPEDAILVRGIDPSLNLKSIQALREWRFQPATVDGHPYSCVVTIEMNFRLY